VGALGRGVSKHVGRQARTQSSQTEKVPRVQLAAKGSSTGQRGGQRRLTGARGVMQEEVGVVLHQEQVVLLAQAVHGAPTLAGDGAAGGVLACGHRVEQLGEAQGGVCLSSGLQLNQHLGGSRRAGRQAGNEVGVACTGQLRPQHSSVARRRRMSETF
jgi:hypothetical protein